VTWILVGIRRATHRSIGQVRRQDDRLATANKVAKVAEGLAAALKNAWERGVLVRIAERNHCVDAILLRAAQLTGSQVSDLSTLTV